MKATKIYMTYRVENKVIEFVSTGPHDIMWSKVNRLVRESRITKFEITVTWEDDTESYHTFDNFQVGNPRGIEREIFICFLNENNFSEYYLGWEGIQVDFFKVKLNQTETVL